MKDILKMCLGTIKRIPLFLSMLSIRSKNMYIFGAWYGKKYSDNSRALFEYCNEKTNKRCIWICDDKGVCDKIKGKGYRAYLKSSFKGIYYQLRASVAFSCTGIKDFNFLLLGRCIHIELWHGVGGGKTIGLDDKEYKAQMDNIRGRYYRKIEAIPLGRRYFISTSDEMKRVFMSAFLVPADHFIVAGQPRNDMFFDETYCFQTIDLKRFRNKKIILYMPTHRKEGKQCIKCNELFNLDLLDSFCEKNNCVFVIKKHFYHKGEQEKLEKYKNIIDITNEDQDSNELLLISDFLISDYSSVTADYLLLDRPIFYYCFDFEEYIKEDREMYWEYDSITPGSRSVNFDQLVQALEEVIEKRKDVYVLERKRVREMFYSPLNQTYSCEKIIVGVENILASIHKKSRSL